MASSILLIITASRDFHAEDQATVKCKWKKVFKKVQRTILLETSKHIPGLYYLGSKFVRRVKLPEQ